MLFNVIDCYKFLEVKTELYDKYFEYRFVYNLRNYLIHEDLAVMKVSYAYYTDHVDTAFLVVVNDLICAEKIILSRKRCDFKNWLKNEPNIWFIFCF